MSRRKYEGLVVDYAINYGLQKFFGQVAEGQLRLELLCKLTFEKSNQEKRIKYKRVTAGALNEFLAAHGKFPSEAETALILKKISVNKGEGKRNFLISEYILAYNKKKRANQQVPPVYQRQSAAVADFKAKFQTTIEKHKSIADSRFQKAIKPEFAQFFSKPSQQAPQQREFNQIAAKSSRKEFTSSISNVRQVEDRIKTLMNSINIKSTQKK